MASPLPSFASGSCPKLLACCLREDEPELNRFKQELLSLLPVASQKPALALAGARKLAKQVLTAVFRAEELAAPPDLRDGLETLGGRDRPSARRRGRAQPTLPPVIHATLRCLHNQADQAQRSGSGDPGEEGAAEAERVTVAVGQLVRVLVWFSRDYARGPRLPSAYAVLPAALERNRARAEYAGWLDQQLDEPLFDEPFGLRQVYVPLRVYWTQGEGEDTVPGALIHAPDRAGPPRRVVGWLGALAEQWLDARDSGKPILFLEGGPGSGKSSFAKVFAARVARSGDWRVLFLPLSDRAFRPGYDLGEAVRAYCRGLPVLYPDDPLNLGDGEKLLLVLDGLDQYAGSDEPGSEVLRHFFEQVQRTVLALNQGRKAARAVALVTGRPTAIAQARSEVRKKGQVLTLLPLLIRNPERREARWTDPNQALERDQRHDWWRYYGVATGEELLGLPEDVAGDTLEEFTASPLLNHLAAIVRSQDRLSLRQEHLSAWGFHGQVVRAAFHRSVEREADDPLAPDRTDLEAFVETLEEVALAAWHGGESRTVTLRSLSRRLSTVTGKYLLACFQEPADWSGRKLPLAFFFRPAGVDPCAGPVLGFSHAGLVEFLVASRLLREVRQFATNDGARLPERLWNDGAALKSWAELCGPARMTNDLVPLLEAGFQTLGLGELKRWQDLLARLVRRALRQGMPMEKLDLGSFQAMSRHALNAEEALLVVLSRCGAGTREISRLTGVEDPALNGAVGDWLNRFSGPRRASFDVFRFLTRVDLPGAVLRGVNLNGANLYKANLGGANLAEANLREVNLGKANLGGAVLTGSDLGRATLRGTDLSGANLGGAWLRGADLAGAVLRGADLGGADLTGACLAGADLTGALLRGAVLNGVKLDGPGQLAETFGTPAVRPDGTIPGRRVSHKPPP